MKNKFLKKVYVIYFFIFSSYIFLTIDWLPSGARSNYIKAGYDKLELLAGVQIPRMIFSGGSSVAFGVDTKKISQDINFNCLNMGLHFLLGAEFYLNQLEDYAKKGDIIFLIFEYNMPFKGNLGLLNQLKITSSVKKKFALTTINNFIDNYDFFIRGMRNNSPIYNRNGFNSNGDFIAHLNEENTIIEQIEIKCKYVDMVEQLNDFHQKISKRGAKLFFLYPPVMKSTINPKYEEIKLIISEFEKNITFPVLGTFENSIINDSLFFNLHYHLNKLGRQKYTDYIIDLIENEVLLSNNKF